MNSKLNLRGKYFINRVLFRYWYSILLLKTCIWLFINSIYSSSFSKALSAFFMLKDNEQKSYRHRLNDQTYSYLRYHSVFFTLNFRLLDISIKSKRACFKETV